MSRAEDVRLAREWLSGCDLGDGEPHATQLLADLMAAVRAEAYESAAKECDRLYDQTDRDRLYDERLADGFGRAAKAIRALAKELAK